MNEPTAGDGTLAPPDAQALDALIEAGYDPDRVPEQHNERAQRMHGVLSLLDTQTTPVDRTLADLAYLRATRAPEPELSASDADALDAWMLAGHDLAKVPGTLRDRAARHEALAGLVSGGEPAQSGSLVERTLAGIQSDIDAEEQNFQISRGRGFRLADLISVAAVLLIGASVLLPVTNEARFRARQAACGAHMASIASAFDRYAGSHADALPVASAGFGGSWWDVGDPRRSNAANLFTLVHDGYAPHDDLACPGNPDAPGEVSKEAQDWRSLDEVSYSYQIMAGPHRPRWNAGRVLVISDASPVVRMAVKRLPIDPWASSANHDGRGQHGLWNDGSAGWLDSPELDTGDNIWLPRRLERAIVRARPMDPIRGVETPDAPDDSFVGP